MRQKRVLLAAVKTMDLVDKQDRPFPLKRTRFSRLRKKLAQLRHASKDSIKRDKPRGRTLRDNPRERGLARARRPPKNHGRHTIRANRTSEQLAFANQMRLTHKIRERARAHPLRKRDQLFQLRITPLRRIKKRRRAIFLLRRASTSTALRAAPHAHLNRPKARAQRGEYSPDPDRQTSQRPCDQGQTSSEFGTR